MTSFQDAFHEGLEASESAERAKQEIESVFDECARQVKEASRGALLLSRESRTADAITGVLASRRSHQALVARAVGDSNTQGLELCEYKVPASGYPVSLMYASVDEYCHDKPSLELSLMELLRHPVTGGKLRRLMDRHVAPANGPPGGEPK